MEFVFYGRAGIHDLISELFRPFGWPANVKGGAELSERLLARTATATSRPITGRHDSWRVK